MRRGRSLAPLVLALAIGGGLLAGCGGDVHTRAVGAVGDPNAYLRVTPSGQSGIPAGAVAVVDLTHAARRRPAELMIASDGTLEHLHWSGWGGASAHARGQLNALICARNCALGHHVDYAATVVLSDPVTCASRRYYNRAAATIQTAAGPRHWGSFVHAPCQPEPLLTQRADPG